MRGVTQINLGIFARAMECLASFASGARDQYGHTTSVGTSSATNYVAPATIMINGDANSTTTNAFNAWMGLTSTLGPKAAYAGMSYDSSGRPTSATSRYGAVTKYTYNTWLPQTQTATITNTTVNNRWTRTSVDGLGRLIKTETAASSGTVQSVVDTIYAPCGCSPMGKVSQVSMPYAPGGTPIYNHVPGNRGHRGVRTETSFTV